MRKTKMTRKENYNRYRCKTLIFAQSNVEKERINNLVYLSRYTNSFFSLKVKDVLDLGSHYGFICEIVESKTLSNENSLSYDYYQKHIKPQKPRGETKKVGWICKICGYIYEGENLPADFICPLCKHPASDFEKLK